LVSVVIPTYNRANDLLRAVQSVLRQSYGNWEAVVVDNHSVDDTDAVLADLGDDRIRVLKCRNGGIIAKSRNLGIRSSRGTIVAFLDSDDWWVSTKLQSLMEHFESGADVVYHSMFIVRNKWLVPTGIDRARRTTVPVFSNLLRHGNALRTSGVAVRHKLLEQVGAMDEDPTLVGAEDFDYWLRLAQNTDRFVMLRKPLGHYWLGQENTSNPARSLACAAAIKARYAVEIKAVQRDGPPAWLGYMEMRARFLLGDYGMVQDDIRSFNFRRASPLLVMKVLWMSIACRLARPPSP
jgi:glycosyltransferase involved in cell wall biosynthesis